MNQSTVMPTASWKLGTDAALTIAMAAREHAAKLEVSVSVCILGTAPQPLVTIRGENAPLAASDMAEGKARASVSLGAPTSKVAESVQPDGPFYGLASGMRNPIVTFAGGVPLVVDGEVIGAIGVSGGSLEQDAEIAETAAGLLEETHA